MRHPADGVLRRMHDDQFAASNRERDHVAQCARCRQRADEVARDADLAAHLFAGSVAASNVEPALARLHSDAAQRNPSRRSSLSPPRGVGRRRWALGAAVAATVTAGLVASASAAGWFAVFSPTQVAPITLTAADLSGLPDLSAYGRMHVTQPSTRLVAGPAEAAAATGLRVLRPTALPAGVPATVTWEVISTGTATFTLDAAAADASAASAGRPRPQVPSGLDGAEVTVNAGPAVLATYGAAPSVTGRDQGAVPTLVIAEGVRPTASTNGATLQQLEDFLLAQPGVSPQLAAEIRAIGQPASTLPVPVISGLMSSQTITIDGVQGVTVGDSTGLGSAVIWEKDGVVHVVGGLLPQSEVVDIARSLR